MSTRVLIALMLAFGLIFPTLLTANADTAGVIPGLPGVFLSPDGKQLRQELPFGDVHEQENLPYQALFTPNDPDFDLQWNFEDIGIPSAWDADTTTPIHGGTPGVVVAVLDTGVSYEKFGSYREAPDLESTRIFTNSGETAGNGIDDDGNGFVDDIHGWDFINSDAHPNDDHGHGTHVTGTIAQATDNGLATAGIAFETTILPIKVLNATGFGSTATVAAGVRYAAGLGADVINLSLGGEQDDQILHDAIIEAANQGVIVVAAAGNDGGGHIDFPAFYSEVVSVGATQYDRTRAPYSDIGSTLDLVAPGGNLSLDQNSDTYPDGILQQTCTSAACSSFGTFFSAGTSQATAHVSGVIALVAACGAPPGTIVGTLVATATDLGAAGHDNSYGHGLINAPAALAAAGCTTSLPSPPGAVSGVSSATTQRSLHQREAYPYPQPVFSWTGANGAVYEVRWRHLGVDTSISHQTGTTFSPTITQEGPYRLEVRTIDATGRLSAQRAFTYRYRKPVYLIGQTSFDPGVRLYRPDPAFIRAWPGLIQDMPVHVAGGALEFDGTNRIVGTGQYWGTSVKVYTTRGQPLLNLVPFGSTYRGGIDLAVMRRPGQGMLVTSSRSEGATLKWYDQNAQVLNWHEIYATYRGGLEIASGDIDGDGTDELVVSMSRSHEIRVYNWNGQRLSVFSPLGGNWRGGFAITTGDMDGDGNAEIIATPRTGGGNAPVFLTTLKGVVKGVWRLNTGTYTGEMDIQGIDVDEDGIDELLAMNKSGPTFIQQWTLEGVKEKEYQLFTDGRGGSLSALE